LILRVGGYFVLISIGWHADHDLVLFDILRHELHDLLDPERIRDRRIELRGGRCIGGKLEINALLVVRHDADAIAIFIYLFEVIGVHGRIRRYLSAVVARIDWRAGFDITHQPLRAQSDVETFEKGREIFFVLRMLPFKIDVDAVEPFSFDEIRNAIFKRDATR